MKERNLILLWAGDHLGGLRWEAISNFCRMATCQPASTGPAPYVFFCYACLVGNIADQFSGQFVVCSESILQVLPLQNLLRTCWNTQRYLHASPDTDKPFLVEDGSRAHVQRISELMTSNYDWSTISLVALLSAECDLIGQWSEGCPCDSHQQAPTISKKRSGQEVTRGRNPQSSSCPFKCCRAPELATGKAMLMQSSYMGAHQNEFKKCLISAPAANRTEFIGAWERATSRLFGCLE